MFYLFNIFYLSDSLLWQSESSTTTHSLRSFNFIICDKFNEISRFMIVNWILVVQMDLLQKLSL